MELIPNIFKAYDIRGLVDTEIDVEFAFATGMAFARFLQIEREPGTIVIGEDMRPSSPELAEAFSAGATSQGMDVIRIGLASTDMLYFASGKLGLPGAMFTASHNPAQYNGIKLCLSKARPIGKESGLATIENFVREGSPIALRSVGVEKQRNMLEEYVDHLLTLVDVTKIRPLKIVVDAGNGMAGHTAPAIFARLNCEVIPMYFELDGSFPNHEANPLDETTLKDLKQAMIDHKADLGLAFDGDADRCFLVDEKGALVNPSALTALIATRELAKNPGASIIYNLISSRAVKEVVEEALGETKTTLSELLKTFNRYHSSGEINSTVSDAKSAMDQIEKIYGKKEGVEVDYLDGLTVSHADWWFNLRASNTEPLLRLNVEASSEARMKKVRDDVLNTIRGDLDILVLIP